MQVESSPHPTVLIVGALENDSMRSDVPNKLAVDISEASASLIALEDCVIFRVVAEEARLIMVVT